jgi:hypothetical protein
VASLSRSLAPPVLGAGTSDRPIEVGSDLGPPGSVRGRRSSTRAHAHAHAREVCADIAEELVQLAALVSDARVTRLDLDQMEGSLYGVLSVTAEVLHHLGNELLAAHSALTCARLAAPEGR